MNQDQLDRHRHQNRFHTIMLLGGMALLLALLGWTLFGLSGLIMAASAAILFALISPSISPQVILRMYKARQLNLGNAPDLVRLVNTLAERADLPAAPALYYIPSRMINAFAVGRERRAAMAVTDGLLRALDGRELAGVLAHEISHLRFDDTYVMGLADFFSRLTSVMANIGWFLLLFSIPMALIGESPISFLGILALLVAPTIATLLQLGLSRTREFDADLGAAELTGDPHGLASALQKIDRANANWFERIFLPGRRVPEPSLLRTHPPTEERIKRLVALKPTAQPPSLERLRQSLAQAPFGSTPNRDPRWRIHGLWY